MIAPETGDVNIRKGQDDDNMVTKTFIRPATLDDIPAIAAIYDRLHTLEEAGEITVGWQRGVYPTSDTARGAIEAGDMFVLADAGCVVASGRINGVQMPAYAQVPWRYEAREDQVLVLHTLTVDPALSRRGYARQFLQFYEDLARERGCIALRIDTNARNAVARGMYAAQGYVESGIIPCVFNGIPGVELVCMEKAVATEAPASGPDCRRP